jgi:ankyrin repeat protein
MKKQKTLIYAVQRGRIAAVRKTLKEGGNSNERDEKGWTPLHWAAQEGLLAITRLLIQKGADVNVSDDLGFTPLYIAAAAGHRAVTGELLAAGASPNLRNPSDGNGTALHAACSWGRSKVVNELLKSPTVKINLKDDDGKTPLAYAVEAGNKQILADLKKRGGVT